MPSDPSPAQRAASRANGARAHGPTSAAGRARCAEAATRHGLGGSFRLLPEEDATAYERLRAAWIRRLAPRDAAEEALVDALVAAYWRGRRLAALEERVLSALLRDGEAPGLPSLATLARYRARLERDRRAALAELEALRASELLREATGRGGQQTASPPGAGAAPSQGAPPLSARLARAQPGALRLLEDAVERELARLARPSGGRARWLFSCAPGALGVPGPG
ncbi:MAG: hypothetical protein N3D77_05590 [Geminicoccaceae bacterium]|nr:hypothetical protein [Geminicoccaceae bacterium]